MAPRILIPAIGALALCLPAHADRLSFDYAEIGGLDTEIRDVGSDGIDGTGGFARLSLQVMPAVYGVLRYGESTLEPESASGDFDQQRLSAGFGIHGTNSETFRPFLEVLYEDYELTDPNDGDVVDEGGWSVETGVRKTYTSWFELNLSARYFDIDGFANNDFGYRARGLFDVSERFALFLGWEDIEDIEQASAGLRVYFGNPLIDDGA